MKQYDEMINRFTNENNIGKLRCIAGRPVMGKSALMIFIALNLAKNNIPTAIFSLEMPNVRIVRRLISAYSDFSSEKIRLGDFSKKELKDFENDCRNLSNFPLFIDDTPGITIAEIKKKVGNLKEERNIKVVFIDYLQLVNTDKIWTSRKEEVDYILSELKQLSEECRISIVILSQLSKMLDTPPPYTDSCWMQSLSRDSMRQFVCEPDFFDLIAFVHTHTYYSRERLIQEKYKYGEEPITIIIEKDQDGNGSREEYDFTLNKTTGRIY